MAGKGSGNLMIFVGIFSVLGLVTLVTAALFIIDPVHTILPFFSRSQRLFERRGPLSVVVSVEILLERLLNYS